MAWGVSDYPEPPPGYMDAEWGPSEQDWEDYYLARADEWDQKEVEDHDVS